VLGTLFRPWTTTRTWRTLSHALLDLVVGSITFSVIIALLATTAGLLVTVVFAIPVAWLTFVLATGLGRVERTRFASLLDVELDPPYPPLAKGSFWRHLLDRVKSPGRWREIGYLLLLLPLGVVTFTAATVTWCGSFALIALPLYVGALPGGTAKFGLFEIGSDGTAIAAAAVGAIGVLLLAPWTTVAMGKLSALAGRHLLGAPRRDALEAKVEELDASRTAALDSAEAERRRIERDLHDGAQQRLVALGMDLGRAKEQFHTHPDRALALITSAHEEAKEALAELRHLVRGFHPAILEDRGLDAALSSVVARCPVPVTLKVDVPKRPSAPVENTIYFAVTEALANVAKHARASRASVSISARGDRLVVEIADDGVGGARVTPGSGLAGLAERVAAVGGRTQVVSPAGGPTSVFVEVPCAS
jgi:signal transduction histidine kinase